MYLILRFRGVPHAYDALLRTAIESALDGDWCVTLSRSHLDGQWHLQLDGETQRCRVVLPELASSYLARRRVRAGMVTADGPVVRAFARIGWEWGGSWRHSKDYMHFSRNGL